MKLISLNTGRPRDVEVHGRTVRTSIWKSPRAGRLHVSTLNIGGDEQSDLASHGGTYKAVYCYPSEHYEYWRRELPHAELPWGVFGENLTTEGLLETDVHIGDRLEIGCVTRNCALPISSRSPMWTSVSSRPSVVRFSPKTPQGSSACGSSRRQYS